MALGEKLADWQAAGLIDKAAAARISAYESERARPLALWAVIGLGLLALAMGAALLVAANWDGIPASVKLGAHFLLTAGAAYLVWQGVRRDERWLAEGALFLFAALVLGGLALQGQVFQLVGPTWQLLLIWLAIATPAVLLQGETRLTAYGWSLLALWACGAWSADQTAGALGGLLIQGFALALPWLIAALAGSSRLAPPFRSGLIEAMLVLILGGVSLAHVAWADPVTADEAGDMAVRFLLVVPAALAAWFVTRRTRGLPRLLAAPLLIAPAAALALATIIPHGGGWAPRLIGALIYAAMWGWIAWGAARAGWRTLFSLAIGALAVRLFIVFFELFGSLATTGAGLIAAGALVIGLSLGWRRIVRRSGL